MKCEKCSAEMYLNSVSEASYEWLCSNSVCTHQHKEQLNDNQVIERSAEIAGGITLAKAVTVATTGLTGNPALGMTAGGATRLVPKRVKVGAAIGAVIGGSAPAHMMAIGTAGAYAFGASIMAPAMLTGALIVGGLAIFVKD